MRCSCCLFSRSAFTAGQISAQGAAEQLSKLFFFLGIFKKLRLTCKAAALSCLPLQERFPTSSWSPGHYHWHHHDDWLWSIMDKRMAPCGGRWSSGKLEFRPSLHPTRSWQALPIGHHFHSHCYISISHTHTHQWWWWSSWPKSVTPLKCSTAISRTKPPPDAISIAINTGVHPTWCKNVKCQGHEMRRCKKER